VCSISGGRGGTSRASVSITPTGHPNPPPVAVNDTASTSGAPVTVGVLGNDYDPNGDPLTVTSVGTPQHGTAVNNGNGTVTYTPYGGASASSDSFTYSISDGHGGTSDPTITRRHTSHCPTP